MRYYYDVILSPVSLFPTYLSPPLSLPHLSSSVLLSHLSHIASPFSSFNNSFHSPSDPRLTADSNSP